MRSEKGRNLVKTLLLQLLPQRLSDTRQSDHWFVSHWLADKVPMLLRRGGHGDCGNTTPSSQLCFCF